MKPSRKPDPFRYVVAVRLIDGHIDASAPDFPGMRITKPLSERRPAEQIGMVVLQLMKEVQREIEERFTHQEPIPPRSEPKGSIEPPSRATLTVKDAARILAVSQETIRRLCAAKKLQHTIVGKRHRRFRLEDIQRFKGEQERNYQG